METTKYLNDKNARAEKFLKFPTEMQEEAIRLYQETDTPVSWIARELTKKYGVTMRDEHMGAIATQRGFQRSAAHKARSLRIAMTKRVNNNGKRIF
jgi:hypothetical protein